MLLPQVIFCQVGVAHSSNSHGYNQAWSCHLYEFAWFVQSTLCVLRQLCTYHESACTFFPVEAYLITWQRLHALSLTFVHTC